MFLLQKATDVTASDLIDVFAFPDRDGTVVRATMISSLDGAATANGRSGVLGEEGDRVLFATMRAAADAILVGANTAVIEGYGVPRLHDDVVQARRAAGRPAVPALVLTSRSLSIPADFATACADGVYIATCESAPADARERLAAQGATLIDCGVDDVDPHRLLAELAERGLTRIDCEGGPRLLGALAAAGVLDQLMLTLSPTLTSGESPRIAHGDVLALPDQDLGFPARLPYPMRMRRAAGDDDGYLYTLWEAVRGPAARAAR